MSEEGLVDISADESGARELVSFILYLFEAKRPILQSTLRHIFCTEKSDEAARKMLNRFCIRAQTLGITIKKTGNFSTGTMEIDPSSFYLQQDLPPEDSLLGFIKACEALLAGNTVPYADNLRIALAKLDPNFAGSEMPSDNESLPLREKSRISSVLLSAIEKSCAVEATYVDAQSSEKDQLLAPLGRFVTYGNEYLVAATLTQTGDLLCPPKTYRVDRFERARALPEILFETPKDFVIQDFCLFPFELGPQRPQEITFKLLKNFPPSLRRQLERRAVYQPQNDQWTIVVRNLPEAVTWALANDILPIAPQTFVDAWKDSLMRGVKPYGNK